MDDDFADLDERLEDLREQRLRKLGTRKPRCSVAGCDERDPLALTGTHPDIVCAEHRADGEGRSWTQGHHVSGQSNAPETAAVPANDHDVMSAYQSLWPRETLRNPDGSPLLRTAAAIRGWLEVLRVILERTVAWIPPFLEALDAWLCEQLGPRWWEEFGFGESA